jgi:fructose-1-phosphate kinase PfkB-like protein
VLLTGSLPPGAPESLYAQLLEALEGYRVIVDAAGAALARCLEVRPYLVKPNSAEARKYGADPVTAAEELVAAGAHWALVTVGADGAILAGNGETLRLIAPAVDSINPTGSGDALAAGILIGLESGRSLRDALRLGVAAAADNTTRQTAGRVERETVDALEPRVEMRRL